MTSNYTVTARDAAGREAWTVRGVAQTAREAMTRAARAYAQSANPQQVTWTAVSAVEARA